MSDEQVDNFLANGKWIDEEDLDDIYKHKLAQLAGIKKRARTFIHPTRMVKLYEDLDFDSSARALAKRKEESRVEVQSVGTMKNAKKHNTDNSEPNVKQEKNKKPLTDKQKEKCHNLEHKLSAANNTLTETVANVEQ